VAQHHHAILVVEDDYSMRNAVAEFLSIEGFDVVEAADGVEALEQIDRSRPCLVVLDLMLPGLGGPDVAYTLRERGEETPVVVLSAARDADQLAREIDAVACLRKPFQVEDLLTTIRDYANCPI
jgi:two-component system response regulator MprA